MWASLEASRRLSLSMTARRSSCSWIHKGQKPFSDFIHLFCFSTSQWNPAPCFLFGAREPWQEVAVCWPAAFSVSAGCELASSGLCCPLLAGSSSPGQVNAAPWASAWLLDRRWHVYKRLRGSIDSYGIKCYERKAEPSTPRPPAEPCTPPPSPSPSCDESHSGSGPSAAAGSGWWRAWAAGRTCACCW